MKILCGFLGAMALFLVTGMGLARADDVPGGGPRHILISYRSEPAARPAFRTYLAHTEAQMLDKLKAQGVLSDYQILFNPFTNVGTWDAMVVLDFSNFGATARWQDIERTRPGGLDKAGLKLAKPYRTYSVDLFREGVADNPGPASSHVYYVIPYLFLSNEAEYKSYVDGYVVPQNKGWMKDGVLSRYRIFVNRYGTGDPEPWDALFIYEYRDLDSFGKRDETVAKVRASLQGDTVWKHWSDIKAKIRGETENTITELLAPKK
jgi:hypothetical protein